MVKIVFDTNIFAEIEFDKIRPHIQAIAKHQVFGNSKALDELIYTQNPAQISRYKQLEHFLQVTNRHWLQHDPSVLVAKEFSTTKRDKYWLLPCEQENRVKNDLYRIIRDKGNIRNYSLDTSRLNMGMAANKEIRAHLLCLRKKAVVSDPFDKFLVHSIELRDYWAKSFLAKWVPQSQDAYAHYLDSPERYPYFTLLLGGWLYMIWESICVEDGKMKKIEDSARNDMIQIVLLKEIDIFVTEDQKNFNRRCFDALWGTSKQSFNIDQFIAWLEKN
jgi:hypothetical protein